MFHSFWFRFLLIQKLVSDILKTWKRAKVIIKRYVLTNSSICVRYRKNKIHLYVSLFLQLLFGFYDPCHLPSNPGWPLRNYLALIRSRWNLETVWFFCYRESRGFADLNLSLVGQASITLSSGESAETVPNSVGWELNKGKRIPRSISLANSMDPTRYIFALCQ